MKFSKRYFLGFLMLLSVETGIALFADDGFIRPFFGDFLAVIAVYSLVMTFVDVKRIVGLTMSLVLAFFIEWLQYIDFLSIVNWKEYKLLRVVFGSTFHWGDILAYSLGAVLVFIVENKRKHL